VLHRFSSLTSVWYSESVRWLLSTSANQFAEESMIHWISSLTSLCFTKSVHWWGAAHRISLLMILCSSGSDRWRFHVTSWMTSLWCSESVRWLVFVSTNYFADKSVIQRFSSLTSICSLTSLCFNESVRRWVFTPKDLFADDYVFQQIFSLTRLCGAMNQFAEKYVHHRISSLTSLCFSESVR
jgi:hypothetical protein